MNKENILFGIVGLLLGLMIGFFFANSVNQSAALRESVPAGNATELPDGHPAVPGGGGSGPIPEVQTALENAKQNPSDFNAQVKAAEMYYQIQRFDQAAEFLQKANELQPDNYEVLVHLGNVYFDSDRYEEAERWYTAALAKQPDDADVRTDLGLTFLLRGTPNYDRAVQEFKRVLAAKPTHKPALQNLTAAYTKKADVANAKLTLAQLEEIGAQDAVITKLRDDIQKLEKK